MKERRKFVRLNAQVDIVYAKHKSPEKVKLSLTKNISKGGICLICYEEVKKSDLLDLKIHLPECKRPINAIGRVVWVKEFTISGIPDGKRFDAGIEFIKINNKHLRRIEKYIFTIIK